MQVWHATKKPEGLFGIIVTKLVLANGRNVSVATKERFAHFSLTPFESGSWALDVIGDDTNEAWLLELTIADDTVLVPDPSGEDSIYGGQWVIAYDHVLVQRICRVLHIEDVLLWELGKTRAQLLSPSEWQNQ